jgi:steroid 5-alpha reductase family enzyme
MYYDVVAYLGYGLILMLVVMSILWVVYRLMDEPSLVDIGWAAGLGALCLNYLYYTEEIGIRQVIVAAAAVIWSLRLVWHLFDRFRKGIADKRYRYLNEIWAENLARNYLFFFLFQGVAAVVLSIVFAIAMLNRAPFNAWDVAGIVLFAIGISGESWADWTLKKFRESPGTQTEVCRRGLWRYSRHPNYFFELVIWIGFSCFAMSAPYGYIGLLAPVLLAIFIFRVTGIPATERQLLASKGDKYREYQDATSVIIPWFPNRR